MTRAVGCDLSRYNVSFDPAKATEPINFAFQKATQGTSYVDLEYENIWQGVKQVQVRGAYHYQDGSSWTAQADHFLRTAEKHDYHIYALDLEEYGNTYNETFFADAKRIIDRWRVMENKVVIYTNGATYDQLYLTLVRLYGEAGGLWLDATPLWIASPARAGLPILPKYRTNKDWLIHQYAWNGLPSRWGTGGNRVDENVFCGDMETFATYFKLGSVILPPVVIGEPMRYTAKSIYGMALRPFHSQSDAALEYIRAGDAISGDELWVAPVNIYDGTRLLNKAGDKWLIVKDIDGAPKTGYVAIVHLGSIYCKLTENPVTPPPANDSPPDYIMAHWIATNKTTKYIPE